MHAHHDVHAASTICLWVLQWILEFPYPVGFFRESVAGGRVKQSPQTLQQELVGGKSFKLLQSPWRLRTTRLALTEKTERDTEIPTQMRLFMLQKRPFSLLLIAMSLKGKILTVTGIIDDPKSLGVVLPHEHLLLDFKCGLRKPEYGVQKDIAGLNFEMMNLGKIRHFPYGVKKNLIVESEQDIIPELEIYKKAGGGTVCDVTPIGLRINPELLPKMSVESGVHIVAGTAYYVENAIPKEIKNMTIEQISDNLVREITEGIEGSGGVRCGLIGEMGCSYPLTANEEKCLRASALAQQKTGAPLIIHPGRDERSPFQILDVLEEAGADIPHTVMSHLDRTIYDNDLLLKFAKRGCYLEYDLFGIECSHYQHCATIDFPSDAQRIQKVKLLVDNGYAKQVLLAHDIHTKHRMVKYGGHGYGHILENILPKMKERGISEENIKLMTEDNPQRWLMFS